MSRELSEPEQKAKAKYKGLTRREYNRLHSRHANARPKVEKGRYQIVVLFDGNPVAQTAPFDAEVAALMRFEKLMTNPKVLDLKLVRLEVGKTVTLYQFQRGGPQEFANSTIETLWRTKTSNSLVGVKAIKASPKLTNAWLAGELEVAKREASGGFPNWTTERAWRTMQ